MKRHLALVAAVIFSAVFFSSCGTLIKTAKTIEPNDWANNITVADLDIADERVSYTLYPTEKQRHGSMENIKKAAEAETKLKYGGADLLLEPLYVVNKSVSFICDNNVDSVTVSGRPARYVNIRPYGSESNHIAKEETSEVKWWQIPAKGFIPSQPEQFRKKGVAGHYSQMIMMNAEGVDSKSKVLSSLVSVGYQITSDFYIGAGTGLMFGISKNNEFIPLFGNARYYFSQKESSFFIDGKIGYGWETHKNNGGLFTQASIGYSFGYINFAIVANTQKLKYTKNGLNTDTTSKNIGISIGANF